METIALVAPLWRRVLAWPRASLGRWSLGLLGGFAALMCLLPAIISLYGGGEEVRRLSMKAGGKFFSLPLPAFVLLAAAASAVAGGVAALVAIIRKGERSILMIVPIIVGAFVSYFAIGEMVE
jgi:hypothetical protein